jgi:hypothetical protein
MGEKRSAKGAQAWAQLDLLADAGGDGQGVGARQAQGCASQAGGGYLDICTTPEVGYGVSKKIGRKFSAAALANPRERALLEELDAMGLSRVMLQVAHAIGFDNFMAMWRILDGSHEALADNDSGIYVRLQRLSAYRRYQRNRFIESLVAMNLSHAEIALSVKRDLGEEVSDRHIWRLMAGGRVKS